MSSAFISPSTNLYTPLLYIADYFCDPPPLFSQVARISRYNFGSIFQKLVPVLGQDLEGVPEPPDPALVAVVLVRIDVEPQVLVYLEHRVGGHLVEDALC